MNNSNTTCYLNNGLIAETNYFCGLPNQGTCCGPGWECLSNGLCWDGSQAYAQGTCIDPSFKTCLSFCNYAQPGNFTVVTRCELDGNSWCFRCALQDPNGPSCCDTNRTTSLEPYPFTAEAPPRSTVETLSSTTSISSVTKLTSISLSSLYPGTSLESTGQTSIKTSTQTSATTPAPLASSPSTQITNQSHNSKMDIYIGITVAVVVVALAIIAFLIFQNRKFKQRLLQLREGPSGQGEARTAVPKGNKNPPGELDLTFHELAQRDTPQHELSGDEIYELYRGMPEHDLIGAGFQR